MEPIHRLSMSTSLKNARIFDDDAWDEDDCPKIKQESKEDFVGTSVQGRAKINLKKIKEEPEEDPDDTFEEGELENSFCNKSIKQEIGSSKQDPKEEHDDIFEEGDCDHTFREGKCASSFNDKFVKQEVSSQMSRSHDDTMEDGELEDSFCETKHLETSPINSSEEELADTFDDESFGKAKFRCKTPPTPPPPIISSSYDASIDRMFDESPYNKEMFKTLKIKEETPVKTENEDVSKADLRNTLKSAKRTVFSRPSPYKKVDSNEMRFSARSRLGEKVNSDDEDEDNRSRPRKQRKHELESDPAVVARREKQIEYGKNTIGYENYIKTVPRSERKLDDPQTPPKFVKYSRRGWEGLIKQWRIKLHRFDPPDNDDS